MVTFLCIRPPSPMILEDECHFLADAMLLQ